MQSDLPVWGGSNDDALRSSLDAVFPSGYALGMNARTRVWLKRNSAALDAYNKHVEEHGVFSEGLRSF
jgi:antitoxin CcdA